MRTAHYTAFESAVGTLVPELAVYDGDAPLNPDGSVRHETYLVLHDMGFDSQGDVRLAVVTGDAADGTYRVVVRVVATTRAAAREVAGIVKARMVGVVLTITSRTCGAVEVDPGPHPVERDDTATPPLFYVDVDLIWRSQRA